MRLDRVRFLSSVGLALGLLLAAPVALADQEQCETQCTSSASAEMQRCLDRCPAASDSSGAKGFQSCARRCTGRFDAAMSSCTRRCPDNKRTPAAKARKKKKRSAE
ncbi:hypothetical protein [Hyalangium gracile]|uniref:hypothetical protein n=1 Tax=Hyalangium gracile TaxID=394092 RepID=UPI001CC99B4B|nr:hypothetical protein [Hyalangium gracile]